MTNQEIKNRLIENYEKTVSLSNEKTNLLIRYNEVLIESAEIDKELATKRADILLNVPAKELGVNETVRTAEINKRLADINARRELTDKVLREISHKLSLLDISIRLVEKEFTNLNSLIKINELLMQQRVK